MVFDPIINEQIMNNLPSGFSYHHVNILFSIYFLSCIIKEVKNDIKNKYYKNINENDIKWEINMSAPINDYQGKIYDLYYNVLNSAYILANDFQTKSINIDNINKIYSSVKNGSSKKYDILSIHPELFVEAVYFTEDRKPGLDYGSYMIMDIGGGTVDIGILWRRKWENSVKYDLVVINILKYGVEIIINELNKLGIVDQDINSILKNGEYNEKIKFINDFFVKNIQKMIDIESIAPKVGIDNITKKLIYYAGGASNLLWYKNIVGQIKNNIITEDKIPIKSSPLNYKNKQDAHRLIISMELAQPLDGIEMNFGSTIIINAGEIISGNDFSEFEIKEANIIRPKTTTSDERFYAGLDYQKEIYGG
jgi:hypothetical protein